MLTMTRIVWMMVTMLGVAVSVAMASPPPSPYNLSARAGLGVSGETVIYASWQLARNHVDSNFNHDGSRIYLGVAQAGMIYFRQVMEVADTVPGHALARIPINAPGGYYVYVTAYNGDGESPSSDTVYVEFNQQDELRYPSSQIAEDTLRVNRLFIATYRALGPPARTIVYSLGSTTADGATYDASTGEFRWTPGAVGRYTAQLHARFQDDSTVTASAFLTLVVDSSNTTTGDSLVYFLHGARNVSLEVGDQLTDTVSAVATNRGTIWYGLLGAPSGMTIDPSTGRISWRADLGADGSNVFDFRVIAGLAGETQHRASIGYRITVRITAVGVDLVGFVRDSSGTALVPAEVNIYSVTPAQGAITYTLVAQTSARQGYFNVSGLAAGTYIAQAIPYDSSMHAAAYYVSNSVGVLNWQDATRFTLSPNTLNDTIVIRVPFANGRRGSNHLDGSVLGNGGTIRKDGGDGLAGLVPVVGAVVYAIDAQGQVAAFDVTDDAGMYGIDGLGTGAYNILVDKVGYRTMVQSVTFDDDNGSTQTIPVELQSTSGGSSVPVDRMIASTLQTIPNPSTTSLRVTFDGNGSTVLVRLVDNSGRAVMIRTVETIVGTTVLELPVSNVAAGRYIVSIAGEAGVAAVPVVIVR